MAKKKDNILVLCLSLAIIAAFSAGILACVDKLTKDARAEAKLKKTKDALKLLTPVFDNNPVADAYTVKDETGDEITFFPIKEKDKLTYIIGKTVSKIGYGGNMTVMVVLNTNGTIEKVYVPENKETPGLGTVVVDRVRQKTIGSVIKSLSGDDKDQANVLPPNPFLDQFDDKTLIPDDKLTAVEKADQKDIPLSKFKVKKDNGEIDQVSGATISSRACTNGVKIIALAFYNQKAEILKQFANEK